MVDVEMAGCVPLKTPSVHTLRPITTESKPRLQLAVDGVWAICVWWSYLGIWVLRYAYWWCIDASPPKHNLGHPIRHESC